MTRTGTILRSLVALTALTVVLLPTPAFSYMIQCGEIESEIDSVVTTLNGLAVLMHNFYVTHGTDQSQWTASVALDFANLQNAINQGHIALDDLEDAYWDEGCYF